jgi:type IV secretion system protein TrbL
MCFPGDLVCQGKDLASSVAGDAIQGMADAVLEGLGKGLASVGSVWVDVGTPNLTTSDGGSTPSDAVGFIQGSLYWYMGAAAVLAVIVGGARMAWEGRAEPGREVLRGLLTLTVVSGAGLTGIALAVRAADGFSGWVLDRSTTGTSFGQNIVAMVGLTSATGAALGPLIVIILGLVALVASFAQIMLMVVRGGMLVILAGVFPLSASFTSTETGRAWFKRCLGWLVAFVLYKPAAAVVYATAFRLTGSDVFGSDGLTGVLTGVVLMILALVALPALMRFTAPVVAATTGGGGSAAMAAVGAVAAMPTGAIPLGGGGRGGSGGGSGPAPSGQHPGGPAAGPSGAGPEGRTGGGPNGASAGGGSGGGASGGGGSTPAAAAASSSGGAAAGGAGAGAAAGGAGAAAAAGPVGVGLAALAAGTDASRRAGQAGADAAQTATEGSTQGGGPSGSG